MTTTSPELPTTRQSGFSAKTRNMVSAGSVLLNRTTPPAKARLIPVYAELYCPQQLQFSDGASAPRELVGCIRLSAIRRWPSRMSVRWPGQCERTSNGERFATTRRVGFSARFPADHWIMLRRQWQYPGAAGTDSCWLRHSGGPDQQSPATAHSKGKYQFDIDDVATVQECYALIVPAVSTTEEYPSTTGRRPATPDFATRHLQRAHLAARGY